MTYWAGFELGLLGHRAHALTTTLSCPLGKSASEQFSPKSQITSREFAQGCSENQGGPRGQHHNQSPWESRMVHAQAQSFCSCSVPTSWPYVLTFVYQLTRLLATQLNYSHQACSQRASLLIYMEMQPQVPKLLELWHFCKPCFQLYSWSWYECFSDLELSWNSDIRKALEGGAVGFCFENLRAQHSPIYCPSNWKLILLKGPERTEEGK